MKFKALRKKDNHSEFIWIIDGERYVGECPSLLYHSATMEDVIELIKTENGDISEDRINELLFNTELTTFDLIEENELKFMVAPVLNLVSLLELKDVLELENKSYEELIKKTIEDCKNIFQKIETFDN